MASETQGPSNDPTITQGQIVEALRQVYPHGHPDFLPTTVREIQLHSDKNHDYAGSGAALGNFDRVAKILALYPGLRMSDRRVVALVYALKQLDAVLWGISDGIVHKVEGLNDRLQDISVYAKIVMCMVKDDVRSSLMLREKMLAEEAKCKQSPQTEPAWGSDAAVARGYQDKEAAWYRTHTREKA